MKHLIMAPLILMLSSPVLAEVIYDTKEEAWDACVSWWKEGGDFYRSEGEGYNMITRKIQLRRCFYDEENKMMVG